VSQIREVALGDHENEMLFIKFIGKAGKLLEIGDAVDLADPYIEKLYFSPSHAISG
jgi:hypothetical protein